MRKNKKNHTAKINNILEFPEEITNNEPKVTIIGFKKIMVENYKGILEYENFFVRLNTTIGVLILQKNFHIPKFLYNFGI